MAQAKYPFIRMTFYRFNGNNCLPKIKMFGNIAEKQIFECLYSVAFLHYFEF